MNPRGKNCDQDTTSSLACCGGVYLPDAARAVILSSMKNRFTAFAVSKGDCFLLELEREEKDSEPFRILVDTGDQVNEAASLLSKHLKTSRAGSPPTLDVVAITHADSDHMRGLDRVLGMNVNISELWLPYIVGRARTMAFKVPIEIVAETERLIGLVSDEELLKAVKKIKNEYAEKIEHSRPDHDCHLIRGAERIGELLLRELYDKLKCAIRSESKESEFTSINNSLYLEALYRDSIGWPYTCSALANHLIRDAYNVRWSRQLQNSLGPLELAMLTSSGQTGIARGVLMFTVCKKADQVKETLQTSFTMRKNMKIRFFDYSNKVMPPQPSSPPNLPVGIINATEIHQIPAGVNPSDLLALLSMAEANVSIVEDRSATNHSSLVLHAPATARYPAVLFSADSDFAFALTKPHIPWSDGMLITAPHHGSESNSGLEKLYQRAHAANLVPTSVWVRSDMKQMSNGPRPGDWWRVNLSASVGVKKYCTCCRTQSPRRRNVVFEVDDTKNWIAKRIKICSCKKATPPLARAIRFGSR